MAKQLVITLGVVGTDKLWTISGTSLVEFSPQIDTVTYDSLSCGIWGDAASRLITCPRQAAGTARKFLHLESGVWVDKGLAGFAGGNKADRIHGYDYNNVYALTWNFGNELKHWDGSTWLTDATLAPVGNLLFDVYVYGPNVEDAVVGGNQYIGFRDSSPRGSGIWTDQWAQLVADVAPTVVTGSYVGAVHAVSASEIYVWLYYATSVNGGRLCKWDGVSWSYLTDFEWPYGPARVSATAGNKQWYSSQYGGEAGAQFFNGSTVVRQDGVPFNFFGGDIWMLNDLEGYVAYSESGTFEFIVRRTTDGTNWSEIVRDNSWTGGTQDVYLAEFTTSVAPALSNQSPTPSSTNNPINSVVSFDVTDADGDLDEDSVEIGIDQGSGEITVWQNDAATPGWSINKTAISNGFTYTVQAPATGYPKGTSITVHVQAEDSEAQTLDESYNFTTATSPTIDTNTPTGVLTNTGTNVSFSTKDDVQVESTSINCTINGVAAIVNGVFQTGWNGTSSSITGNGFNGYDVVIDPESDLAAPNSYTVEAYCEDDTGLSATFTWSFIVYNFDVPRDRVDFVGIGVHPVLVDVQNPSRGVLVATFSEPMLRDKSLERISSYSMEPQGDAAPLFITGVTIDDNQPTIVTLSFVGGGSTYLFSAVGIMDPAGNYIGTPNSMMVNIEFPTVDELFTGENLFFDTDMGSISLGFNELSARRVEDLAILRTQNEGNARQFSLIADGLERSGIDRDDVKLKFFKG